LANQLASQHLAFCLRVVLEAQRALLALVVVGLVVLA